MNKGIILLHGGLLLATTSANAQESNSAQERKNVLFLMSDDFNYWMKAIGYYPQIQTPNLDKLASEGVLFSDAYCSSPVSNPSRNALWSGVRPSTSTIDSNSAGYIRDKEGCEDVVTMNQYFLENGYYVYGAGKLYHPGSMSDNDHIDQENWSERYMGGTGSRGGNYLSWSNPKWSAMKYSVNPEPKSEENCNDFKMVNEVARKIKAYASSENRDKPFFIGCGVFRPHLPWSVPKEYWDLYSTEDIEIPKGAVATELTGMEWFNSSAAHDGVVEAGKWQEAIHAYISLMTMTDEHIGILLDALASTPYKDNTVICFMGDHGWHLGEKESWGKATLYDQASHTSLIIYDPSAEGNGKVCEKVVSLQDIYPTLVEICGLPHKADVEGNSIKTLLDDPDAESWEKPVISRYNGSDFIKSNQWRYVRNKQEGREMLFNVETDPYEQHNLRYDENYSEVVKMMNHQLDSIINIGQDIKRKNLSNK